MLFPHFFTQDDNRLLWCVYGFGGGQSIPIFKFSFSHISLPEMITAYFGVCTVLGLGRAYQYKFLLFPHFLPEMITAYFGACTVLGVGRAYQY